MASGVPRSTNPPGAVVIDPRVIAVGGAVALVGMVVVVMFLWMVPHAAVREVRSACASLKPSAPNPALCPDKTKPCTFPMPAPDFTAFDNQNRQVHLSDYRGKVVLLNFWASWCGVCKNEKPQLSGMSNDLASDDFVVVALASDVNWRDILVGLVDALAPDTLLPSVDGKDKAAETVFEDYNNAKRDVPMQLALEGYKRGMPDGVPFQVLLDHTQEFGTIGPIAASWGIKAVPESALIDRQGNIRAYFVNKRDWESPVAETCLRSLIDEE